ncbi:DUF4097 family beta strand repeat-containing protein [Streptomyces avicenniae]|uniref:DUF4097 family beta strand repeat-containing protein n=1 Tax=Streptomyces avicenniae TaxID=500153 RepID=UPI000699A1B1|nr:DUF4097 family beta strand repeat-containing protein [Streptomyces avicenniae]
MATKTSWSVGEARTLDFDDEPVEELYVGLVGGTVNVVGTAEPTSRVEVSQVQGPPLTVRRKGRRLTVTYDDLSWKGFLGQRPRVGHRSAVVSVSVPAACRVSLGVVNAGAVVGGVAGATEVRAVTGDTTLVNLTGSVLAQTVAGDLDVQGLRGDLRFTTAAGGLTVLDGGGAVAAESVSGDMVIDLAPSAVRADIRLKSVSGELALRLPDGFGAEVAVESVVGAVSSAFGELSARGWGPGRRLSGTLGPGGGSVRCTTVSGPVALLRRPPTPHETAGATSFAKDI